MVLDYFLLIVPKMASFLILLGIGFLIAKIGIISRESMPSFAGFLLKVVLPCLNIVLLAQRGTDFLQLAQYSRIILWQVGAYLLMAGVGLLGARAAGVRGLTANVHAGCSVGGNYAFVVIPLAMALFDGEGQALIPICSAVDTVVVWTLGLGLFTRNLGQKETPKEKLRRFMTPTLLSILLALTLNSLHITLPEVLMTPITHIGEISYSLGFLYVGCSLYFMPKQSRAYLRPVSFIVLGKLLIAPLAVFFISVPFLTRTESILLMLIAGAPSMSTSCTISRQYGLSEDYAAEAVFVTTLACMVTVPALFAILSFIG